MCIDFFLPEMYCIRVLMESLLSLRKLATYESPSVQNASEVFFFNSLKNILQIIHVYCSS